MGKIIPIIIAALVCAAGRAEKITITTTDGQTITDAEISRVTPDGLTLMTSDGIRKVSWSSLPPEIKQKYATAATETGNAEMARMTAKIAALEQENANLRLQLDRLRSQPMSAPATPEARTPAPAAPDPAPAEASPQGDGKEWDRNALESKLDGGTPSGIKALLGQPTSVSAYAGGGDSWSYDGMNIVDRKTGARFHSVYIGFSSGKNPRGSYVSFH